MRTLSLCVLLVVVTPLAAQDDAQSVVKKAIEAHGGAEALNKSKLAKSTAKGTMTTPQGAKVDYVANAIYSLPDKYKLEIVGEFSGVKLITTQILNGKKVKAKATLAGTAQPLPEKVTDETLMAAALQDLTTLTPLLDAKRYTIKGEPETKVNEALASVVLVSAPAMRDVKLYFEKKTGLLIKTSRKGLAPGSIGLTEVEEETFLSDFQKTDAAFMPRKLLVKHNGKDYMTMTITELKFLEKVEATEFTVDE
jgi:outer membrane lipoprotein-sorting protein